jgi:hypothetical protein
MWSIWEGLWRSSLFGTIIFNLLSLGMDAKISSFSPSWTKLERIVESIRWLCPWSWLMRTGATRYGERFTTHKLPACGEELHQRACIYVYECMHERATVLISMGSTTKIKFGKWRTWHFDKATQAHLCHCKYQEKWIWNKCHAKYKLLVWDLLGTFIFFYFLSN